MCSSEPRTGKVRYRTLTRLFRKPLLILQIEVIGTVYLYYGDSRQENFWRDAVTSDLTLVK